MLGIASLLLSATALAVAVVGLREGRDPLPSHAELGAAAVSQLRGLMSQDEVRGLLGAPESVFRDNPRAQCWAYNTPYSVRLCFGAKRRLAWWATDAPLRSAAFQRWVNRVARPS